MSGRPKATLVLTPAERGKLKARTLRHRTAQAFALRARIVLLCADGSDNKVVVAPANDIPDGEPVASAVRRTLLRELAGRAAIGCARTSYDIWVDAVIVRTLESAPRGATHWSTRTMASEAELSQTAVSRIWQALGLQPHRLETFKLFTDPIFVEKVRYIVGLYMDSPSTAVVLCSDETSQIQAMDRTQPLLPLASGTPERRTHDYEGCC